MQLMEGVSRLPALLEVIHPNLGTPKQRVSHNTGRGENWSRQVPNQLSIYQKTLKHNTGHGKVRNAAK